MTTVWTGKETRPKHYYVRNEDNNNSCKCCGAPRHLHPISFKLYGGPVYMEDEYFEEIHP